MHSRAVRLARRVTHQSGSALLVPQRLGVRSQIRSGEGRREVVQADGMRPWNAIGWRSQIAGPTSARRFPQMLLGEIPTVTEPAAFLQ